MAVVNYVQVTPRHPGRSLRLPLAGLDANRLYRDRESGIVRSGAGWMYGGLLLPPMSGDYQSKLIVLEEVKEQKANEI